MERIIIGKNGHQQVGVTPAIVLVNPKYPHNVGSVLRTASCYGFRQVWFTGHRVIDWLYNRGTSRIPREERMRGYREVNLINCDYPFDAFPSDAVPVAVEVRENSEILPAFQHPDNAVYVFGPEDGSLPKAILTCCHRFVVIPSRHCFNLGVTVGQVLYDRSLKQYLRTGDINCLPSPVAMDFVCDLERQ